MGVTMKEKKTEWSKVGIGLFSTLSGLLLLAIFLSGSAGATGSTNYISGSVTVPNACAFVTSNTAINFGTALTAGTNTIRTHSIGRRQRRYRYW